MKDKNKKYNNIKNNITDLDHELQDKLIPLNYLKSAYDKAALNNLYTGGINGYIDALRHSTTSALLANNLPNLPLVDRFSPLDKAYRLGVTNMLGAAHEFSNYSNSKELISDLKNNYIGSKIGVNAKSNKEIPMKTYSKLKNAKLDVLNRPHPSKQISPNTFMVGEFNRGGYVNKYPSGGYLNYQEGYKGFGMGPELYQDNSYFRSVMPDNIEDMEEMINKPSVFSGINDVLGSVNQGVSQVTGLMSRFQNPQTGVSSPDSFSNYWDMMSQGIGNIPKNIKLSEESPLNNIVVNSNNTLTTDGLFNNASGLLILKKNGGYLKKYQDGGEMDMLPVGAPEYIHKSNVFNEQYNPVPRVHFSDDTTAYDMGVNLNDLVNMNGGSVNKYQNGGDMSLQGYFNYLTNQNQNRIPSRAFNSNTGRATLGELQAATQNDFLNTKVRNDRQQFVDNKVDWGAFNFLKEPTGAVLGTLSAVPIVGDITKSALGDSFLTRTGGYTVGSGLGNTAMGAGKIIGGIATGNVGMIGSGVGDIGEGVGSTVGTFQARDAMSDYNKSGYVSGKRLVNASQDFGNMMDTASGLFGNIKGGVGMAKNMGGIGGMFGNMKGGKTGMKGFGNIMGNLTGFRGQDGGYIDENMFMIEEYKNGGVAKKVNNKNKQVTGWLDQL